MDPNRRDSYLQSGSGVAPGRGERPTRQGSVAQGPRGLQLAWSAAGPGRPRNPGILSLASQILRASLVAADTAAQAPHLGGIWKLGPSPFPEFKLAVSAGGVCQPSATG